MPSSSASTGPEAQAAPGAEAPGRPLVRLRGLAKSYGSVIAVHPLDLDIGRGDFLAILGPSGCGKTTLLRMIGGFVAASAGRIEIDGRDVTRLPPERRPTNMVFQGYGLFPHMTVRQNVGYGLRIAGLRGAALEARIAEALALVRLRDLAGRMPSALSGGQAQRVALARALVMRPAVLLLDEPLGALDLQLRKAMQEELRRIHAETGGTFVFVTHDQGEALQLANRVAIMNAGRIEQLDTPRAVYDRPATAFVARFVGEANLLPGARQGGTVRLACGPAFPHPGPDGPVTVVVRPEAVVLAEAPREGAVAAEGRVAEVVFQGAACLCTLALPDGSRLSAALPPDRAPVPGAAVRAAWPAGRQVVLEGRA